MADLTELTTPAEIAKRVLANVPSWKRLKAHGNTVLVLDANGVIVPDEWLGPRLGLEENPHPDPRTVVLPVYPGMTVRGEVTDEHCKRFGELIEVLIVERMVNYAYQCEPLAIPLADIGTGERYALFCYIFSDYTTEQLNKRLGFPYLVDEGCLPRDWPEKS